MSIPFAGVWSRIQEAVCSPSPLGGRGACLLPSRSLAQLVSSTRLQRLERLAAETPTLTYALAKWLWDELHTHTLVATLKL